MTVVTFVPRSKAVTGGIEADVSFTFEAHPKSSTVVTENTPTSALAVTPGKRGYNPNLHLARNYGPFAETYVKPEEAEVRAFAEKLLASAETSDGSGFRYASAKLPVSVLTVEGFQREPNGRTLNDMIRAFDSEKVGPVLINYIGSEGIFSVVDGQTRATYLLRSLGPTATVDALVYFDLTPEQETKVFVARGEARHISLFQRLNAIAWGGEPVARAQAQQLFGLIAELGLTVKPNADKTGTSLRGVDALITMRDKWGFETLALAMKTIKAVYHGKPNAYDASIIKGLTTFLGLFQDQPNFKLQELVKQIETRSVYNWLPAGMPMTIEDTAKMLAGGKSTANIARVFLLLYNAGKKSEKNMLPAWDLVVDTTRKTITKRKDAVPSA